MFRYFGRKKQLARYYPSPRYDTVIEPFAGSAAYSMYHLSRIRRALLIEKDPRVVDLWQYCLSATVAEIEALRVPEVGERSMDFLMIIAGVSTSDSRRQSKVTTDWQRSAAISMLRAMVRDIRVLPLDRIRLTCGDYTEAPDVAATWFVDPPYQSVTAGYSADCGAVNLNYAALASWCRSRKGQVIVCERADATWLPFEPLAVRHNSHNSAYTEGIFVQNTGKPGRLFQC